MIELVNKQKEKFPLLTILDPVEAIPDRYLEKNDIPAEIYPLMIDFLIGYHFTAHGSFNVPHKTALIAQVEENSFSNKALRNMILQKYPYGAFLIDFFGYTAYVKIDSDKEYDSEKIDVSFVKMLMAPEVSL